MLRQLSVANPQPLISESQVEAEACFQEALAIAHQQNAKLWELRAAVSLGHLWRRQGKIEDARRLIVDIHGWFTEGFATMDLQEAQALLNELT